MYRRFGARSRSSNTAPRLIAREDDDVSRAVQAILEREGIAVRTRRRNASRVARATAASASRVARRRRRAATSSGTHLLLAVGRRPNTDDLGLDAAGIATDARGYIVVDDELRTNVAGIWALGDCNGRGAFTHTSYNDYEIVAANLLDGEQRSVSDRIPAYALFIDPPLGRVGMTEARGARARPPALVGAHADDARRPRAGSAARRRAS